MVPTLEQLENHFLSVAPESGFSVMKNSNTQVDLDKTISADAAKIDIADDCTSFNSSIRGLAVLFTNITTENIDHIITNIQFNI